MAVAALPLVAAPPRTIACGYKNEIFSVFSTDFDNRNVFFYSDGRGLIVDPLVKRKKPTPFGVDFYVGGEVVT